MLSLALPLCLPPDSLPIAAAIAGLVLAAPELGPRVAIRNFLHGEELTWRLPSVASSSVPAGGGVMMRCREQAREIGRAASFQAFGLRLAIFLHVLRSPLTMALAAAVAEGLELVTAANKTGYKNVVVDCRGPKPHSCSRLSWPLSPAPGPPLPRPRASCLPCSRLLL